MKVVLMAIALFAALGVSNAFAGGKDFKLEDPFAPALPQKGGDGSEVNVPDSMFFEVFRKTIVTPSGSMESETSHARLEVACDIATRTVTVKWPSLAAPVRYDIGGHEPLAVQDHGETKWKPALRAFRVTASGSIEQVIFTAETFIISSPGDALPNFSIIYARASAAPSVPAVNKAAAATTAANSLFPQ